MAGTRWAKGSHIQFKHPSKPGRVTVVHPRKDQRRNDIHMNSREIIKHIERDGWYKVGQKGSHIQFKHPSKPGRVTVVHPRKDVPNNTLRSIERQSGLKLR